MTISRRLTAAGFSRQALPAGYVRTNQSILEKPQTKNTCREKPAGCPGFPTTRLRRLRYHPAIRRLVRETRLSPANLILPLFVRPGENVREEISAMPGNCQLSPDLLADEIRQAAQLGLGGVILFGIPAEKDPAGSDAVSESGIIPQAIRAAKRAAEDFLLITDVCFCEYTDHGH